MGRYCNTGICIGTHGNPQIAFMQDKYRNIIKEAKNRMNIQLFAINKQKQERHNEGNTTGRSVLYGGEKAAQNIIDNYEKTGKPVGKNKIRVNLDHIIGEYVSKDGKTRTKSNIAIIVKSKTGDHVYPGNPNTWEV